MIITCPNCRTRYRVAADAISAVGRKVQCASCREEWLATPSLPMAAQRFVDPEPTPDETAFSGDDDTMFTAEDEALLDARFERIADVETSDVGIETAGAASPSQVPAAANDHAEPHEHAELEGGTPAEVKARRKAHERRRRQIDRSMPLARFRRGTRLLVVLLFAALLTLVFGFRTELVRLYPELGPLFAQAGLGTNVVGLDFSGVRTLKTTRDGVEVLLVTATLTNVTSRTVEAPPVIVSLVGAMDAVVYEWSVTPAQRQILPGASVPLETRLTAPPPDIASVRLTFAYGQHRVEQAPRTEP